MNLIDVIKSYMDAHSEQVLASLKSTLLSYIQFCVGVQQIIGLMKFLKMQQL